MKLRPIAGLQPSSAAAAKTLACPPYDVVTRESTLELLSTGACQFLRVVRADANLAPNTEPKEFHDAANNALTKLEEDGVLTEADPAVFVYQLQLGTHTQRGIAALVSIDDYSQGKIKAHEYTRKNKENERAALADALGAHTGPVLLAHRRSTNVDEIVNSVCTAPPVFTVDCAGAKHTIWRSSVQQSKDLVATFEAHVDCSYIADGHHRAASAFRVGIERRMVGGTQMDRESDWFTAVLFSSDEMHARPYYRRLWVDDLSKIRPMLEKLQCCPDGDAKRGTVYVAAVEDGVVVWYALQLKADDTTVDNQLLQEEVLEPYYGIKDPRTDERVGFVGGMTIAELEKDVAERGGLAFAPAASSMEEVMRVVDAGSMMPPKSTWFEPKLCSGLFIHTF